MEKLFHVVSTGLLTTFQDLGRFGYQKFGVVTSGAMDPISLQMANCLVGNKRNEACIEISMIGPTFQVTAEKATIAICGANLTPTVNNKEASMWQSFLIKKSDVLRFGKPQNGVRAYLAVGGGYAINDVLESKSYYNEAKIGTPINQKDDIYALRPAKQKRIGLTKAFIPIYKKNITVRVIIGPHQTAFTKNAIEQFFKQTYTVAQGDRMGYRLRGSNPLTHIDSANIHSDAIPLGAIQVPDNGQPIILLNDRQTTGGYTRIGTIISVDIPRISQLSPGSTIHFKDTSLQEAHHLLRTRERFLTQLQWCCHDL